MRQLLAIRIRDGRYRAPRGISLLLAGALTLTACGDKPERTADVDSALARDLTLAGSASNSVALGDTAMRTASSPSPEITPPTSQQKAQNTPPKSISAAKVVSKPTPRPTRQAPAPPPTPSAAAPAPVAAAPAPAPAPSSAPAPAARGSIGAGTLLTGATGAEICSLANRPGDRFVVSLARTVTGSNGAVLEAGTPVLIELASAETNGGFTFRLRGVQVHGDFVPAEGSVSVSDATTSERSVSGGNDKGKVITGAVAGAILGRILGGSTKGAVIGAAGGAAAGTVAAQRSRVAERCMAAGATISVTLSAPLVLPMSTP